MRRLAIIVAALAALTASARAQQCKGAFEALPKERYVTFNKADFDTNVDVAVVGNKLAFAPSPLDPNRIVLPFDSDVQVQFLWEQYDGSSMMGWFYLDEAAKQFPALFQAGGAGNFTLRDNNNDGVPDFYQKTGLFQNPANNALPDLANLASNFSDGGGLPHVPNVLELLTSAGKGGIIFHLCDDDVDREVGWSVWPIPNIFYPFPPKPPTPAGYPINWSAPFALPQVPALDAVGGAPNNIPDYDVNADGIIDAADRTVDLGVLDAGREIVFYYTTFIDQRVQRSAVGLAAGLPKTVSTPVMTFFTKDMLNSDRGAVPPNTDLSLINIGCPWGGVCGAGVRGWLDPPALAALATPTYGSVVLPPELKTVRSGPSGESPHLLVGAPSSYPDLWLIGEEGQVNYENATCGCTNNYFWPPPNDPFCTCGNRDFNDLVTIVKADKGGSVTSPVLSVEAPLGIGQPPLDIPVANVDDYAISKIYAELAASFPAPCLPPPATRVDFYWSIDDGTSWHQVMLPAGPPPWNVTIDVLHQGYSGARLRWRANMITNVLGCRPEINAPTHIGYEALPSTMPDGSPVEYQFAEAIPIANVIYRSTVATSSSTWGPVVDHSARGHLRVIPLYHADSLAESPKSCPCDQGAQCVAGKCLFWDAGEQLRAQNPNARVIYYGNGSSFVVGAGAPLWQTVLPLPARTAKANGALVYDLDGNGVVDDLDAQRIIEWTRGWEKPGLQRPWKLGSIHRSTVAQVGPAPPNPWWLVGAPNGEKTAYAAYLTATQNDRALAIIGAHDGLLHAFDAGQFSYGDDVKTPHIEQRGYFKRVNNALPPRDYGTGAERWAFAPRSQLDLYKNNLPQLAGYKPDLNPRAKIDGQTVVDDIYYNGAFRTLAVAPLGPYSPYLTAVSVRPGTPAAQWPSDWTDTDFSGTYFGPSMGPAVTPLGRRYVTATGSGLRSSSVGPEYFYLIDSGLGTTISKILLGNGAWGTVGYPILVDFAKSGNIDRAYLADTAGRIFRVETQTSQVCLIADLKNPVYAPMTIDATNSSEVRLYIATGDDPDRNDGTLKPASVYRFTDTNPAGVCSAAKQDWSKSLPKNHRVWAAPAVTGDTVFVGTSTGERSDVCSDSIASPGFIFAFDTTAGGVKYSEAIRGNNAVGALRAYDGHLFVNSQNGTTTTLGNPTWNNLGGNVQQQLRLPTTSWSEQ